MGFLTALIEFNFLQYACLAGILAANGCGIVGSYVVVRKITFAAGSIAHAVLGGMGAALYYGYDPFSGAILSAVVTALIIGLISIYWYEREDTIISAMWAIGMATGILFISATPGYQGELFSYLFGNILMVNKSHLILMSGLDIILMLLLAFFHNRFTIVVFDEEFARMRGIPVTTFYLLMLCMVALTVVLVIQVVGLIMVITLLTLPAAIAGHYVNTLGKMMLVAVLLGIFTTIGGLALSWYLNLASGAIIVIITSCFYLLSVIIILIRRKYQLASIALKIRN